MKKPTVLLGIIAGIIYSSTAFAGAADMDGGSGTASAYNIWMLIYTALFIVAAGSCFYVVKGKNKNLTGGKDRMVLMGLLAAGLIFRLVIAPLIEGWPNDIAANKYWAISAAKDFTHFYNNGWSDYPPVMIYVFFIVGKIVGISSFHSYFTLLIKLPSMLADLATAYMLYRVAKKHLGENFGLLAAGVYAFNPAILLNSAIWGQVDSFFTMLVVGGLMLLVERKLTWSTVVFVLALLMKPQGAIFLPVLLFELIKRRSIKDFLRAFAAGAATLVLVILPFSFSQQPLWIVKLFKNTLGEYNYASLNAFNLFGLLGANFKDASQTLLIFSYNTWGMIFSVLILGFAAWIFFKSKHAAAPVVSTLILNIGAFVFSAKMHERYMFPAIALAILAFIYFKDKRILAVFSALSVTIFFNMHILFYRMLRYGIPQGYYPAKDLLLLLFALLNVLLFAYIIRISLDMLWKGRVQGLYIGKPYGKPEKAKWKPFGRTGAPVTSTKTSGKGAGTGNSFAAGVFRFRLDRTDWLILGAMTLIYLVIALVNLGSAKVPQSSWTPARPGESFVLDLGRTVELDKLYYYNGMGTGAFQVEYRSPDGVFAPAADLDKKDIFIWQYLDLSKIRTDQLRIRVSVPGATFNEMGVFEKGSTTPVKGVRITEVSADPMDKGKVENLLDEQNRIDYGHSYLSGMYFDEIYHARTAYEYLHSMEPYEWTHPPLGKIFISIGIALFGMNPFGWRIVGTLFGVAMIPLMYLFGMKVFKKRVFAFCSAFLMMVDFMHFAQSRIATIDVYGAFFVILMYYFIYDYFVYKSVKLGFKKSIVLLGLCGFCFGLGTASKWIGLYAGGGLALLFFLTKQEELRDYRNIIQDKKAKVAQWVGEFITKYISLTFVFSALFFVILPAIIYMLSYIPFMRAGHGLGIILQNQHDMWYYHSKGVLGATHAFSSHWWEWPIMRKPLWTYLGTDLPAGKSSTMVIMGNPAVWWAGIAAVFAVAVLAFVKYKKKIIPAVAGLTAVIMIIAGGGVVRNLGVYALAAVILVLVFSYDKKAAVLFTAIAFQYLPWVPIQRLTFIYHFFSSVPFVILTIVYVIKLLVEYEPRFKYGVYAYLGIAALLFVMFYPVLSGMEVSRSYVDHFLIWFKGSWIF